METVHFTYDPKFITILGIQRCFEKKYHPLNDVALNTKIMPLYNDDKYADTLFADFIKLLEKHNTDTITLELIEEFTDNLVNQIKLTDDYIFDYAKWNYLDGFIYEKGTGYLDACGLGRHQDAIIKWLHQTFKHWEPEEEEAIIKFTKERLYIHANFFDTDQLIRDSVKYGRKI